MGFKNFRLNIVARVSLLTVLLLGLVWSFTATRWEVTPIALGIIAVVVMVELIYYVELSNRKLQSFLSFIDHHDFSTHSINNAMGKSFSELSDTYQLITGAFQQLNAEKEASSQYLASVVEHINVALLCLNADGEVTLMNRQAKLLFHTPYLPNVVALKELDQDLPQIIQQLAHGEQRLVSIDIANENLQLAVHASHFQLLEKNYKLVSFQNIRDELEQQEISSWQKLIRVLTHEIMNSVTPIISLSGALKEKLVPNEENEQAMIKLTEEDLSDLQNSICSIESRSKGLSHFVQAYRRLTAIPSPNMSPVRINKLVDNVRTLLLPELEKRAIALEITGKTDELTINVDAQQIEQVLINLIKNAMEALVDIHNPLIRLHAEAGDRDTVLLQLIDNGPGIASEYIDQIFVPFFTTKHNGTGVGLNISRQIMIQNKGALSVNSAPGKGSIFLLRFRHT
jgi:nitrogen fixation/metabolism regulation signal transduction histidine kinase